MIDCWGCKYFKDCDAMIDVTVREDFTKVYVPGFTCRLVREDTEDERSADDRC